MTGRAEQPSTMDLTPRPFPTSLTMRADSFHSVMVHSQRSGSAFVRIATPGRTFSRTFVRTKSPFALLWRYSPLDFPRECLRDDVRVVVFSATRT